MLKITIDSAEVEKAVRAHISTLGINTDGKQVSLEFTSSRKSKDGAGGGVSVEVSIGDAIEFANSSVNVPEAVSTQETKAVEEFPKPVETKTVLQEAVEHHKSNNLFE